jgi:hypothetical protein
VTDVRELARRAMPDPVCPECEERIPDGTAREQTGDGEYHVDCAFKVRQRAAFGGRR